MSTAVQNELGTLKTLDEIKINNWKKKCILPTSTSKPAEKETMEDFGIDEIDTEIQKIRENEHQVKYLGLFSNSDVNKIIEINCNYAEDNATRQHPRP